MIDVYLLLGSNMGDRKTYLQQAIMLIALEISPVVSSSAVYETQSWGKTDEPDYLNQVILLQTNTDAASILKKILAIEAVIGRKRDVKWGARSIDIDILFYGSRIINEPGLTLPHPEMHKRRFTLVPLVEIAPHLIHPVFQKNMLELKSNLTDNLTVKIYNFDT